jgi:tetratricopeptide (TPR) repeat protein
LERVIVSLPDFVPAYIGLGMSYEALGDLEKAAQYAQKALQLDPQNAAAQRVADEIQRAKK